jgi:hypothetical protein
MAALKFRAFKDGVYVMEGEYTSKSAAQDEQKRYNRIGTKSSIKPEKDKSGRPTSYVLWLKD